MPDSDSAEFPNLATAMARFLPGRRVLASETVNGAFHLQINSDYSARLIGLMDTPVVFIADSAPSDSHETEEPGDGGLVPHWASVGIDAVWNFLT